MLRILCVDDDGLVLSITSDLLRALGHEVVEAIGGAPATRTIEEGDGFDLLVTDPGGDLIKTGAPSGAGLVKDRDCPGTDRRCRGQNMENVFLEPDAEPVRGTYRVTVRLEKLNGARLPIKVRVGARLGPRVYGFSTELGAQGQEQTFTFRL